MERIKASYDRTGEADLTDGGDIMAVAGALKLYLRELPEGIIPEGPTRTFVTTQEGESNTKECNNFKLCIVLELPIMDPDITKKI